MDNFNLKKYLIEGRINEEFEDNISFLDLKYYDQKDFNNNKRSFASIIDYLTDVENSFFNGNHIIGNSSVEEEFEDTFEGELPIDGWDILDYLMSRIDMDIYYSDFAPDPNSENDPDYLEYKEKNGEISYDNFVDNIMGKVEDDTLIKYYKWYNIKSPISKKRKNLN